MNDGREGRLSLNKKTALHQQVSFPKVSFFKNRVIELTNNYRLRSDTYFPLRLQEHTRR